MVRTSHPPTLGMSNLKKGFVEGILDSVREGVPQEFATTIKADPNKPVPALI